MLINNMNNKSNNNVIMGIIQPKDLPDLNKNFFQWLSGKYNASM
jgi:hypothetical protein